MTRFTKAKKTGEVRRTPIAHVIFPRPNALRPVPEVLWEAVRAHAKTDDLDVSVLVPVPSRAVKRLHGRVRRWRGAKPWPDELEAALETLDPKPTLIRYIPMPRRSTEAATAAIATHLLSQKRAQRPRVLHGSFLDEGGYAAAKIGRVLGVPSVAVAHGTDVRIARARVEHGINRKHRAIETLRDATRVIAGSRTLASELAFLGHHADVLYFTSLASRFPIAMQAEGAPQILFAGDISKERGADVLLDAFGRLQNETATLRFVGREVDIDVRSEAQRLGIDDRVTLEREVPQTEVAGRYADATLVALPSRVEDFSCVAVEAMLVGRPVVASQVGGLAEVVNDRVGALVAAGDSAALALAMDAVIARKRELRPGALRHHALPFTWEESAPRFCDITRSLI